MKDQISDFVGKEEFFMLQAKTDTNTKSMGRLMSKDEIVHRLNLLNDNMMQHLSETVTIEYLKEVMEASDAKIDVFIEQYESQLDDFKKLYSKIDKEVAGFDESLSSFTSKLDLKIEAPAL